MEYKNCGSGLYDDYEDVESWLHCPHNIPWRLKVSCYDDFPIDPQAYYTVTVEFVKG